MALRAPNVLLYTDTVTHYSRTSMTAGTRGDLQFPANSGGTSYSAIVTMRTDMSRRNETELGQPASTASWDVKLWSGTDPAVVPDDVLVDDNGRTLVAMSKSTARETGDWLVQCQSID